MEVLQEISIRQYLSFTLNAFRVCFKVHSSIRCYFLYKLSPIDFLRLKYLTFARLFPSDGLKLTIAQWCIGISHLLRTALHNINANASQTTGNVDVMSVSDEQFAVTTITDPPHCSGFILLLLLLSLSGVYVTFVFC